VCVCVCVFCSHALPWKVGRAVWRYDKGWPSYYGTYWRLDRGVWRNMKDGEVVLGLMRGLIEVFESICRTAEQFWDKWKAWPTCLKGLDGRLSCSGTYQRLGRRVWRDWMRGRTVLRLMKGLTDVFEGIGWEAELFWDLWKAWPTSLKGLDESETCSGTYGGLDRRVRRGWMVGRRVMGPMEGLADVFEGVGWEAELFWDLSKAWLTCLKGLDETPSCFETYEGLGQRVWRDWMRGRTVLRLMKGLADKFERVGWERHVFWNLWRAQSTCLKGLDRRLTCLKWLDGRSACSATYDITKGRSRVAKEKKLLERVRWEADVAKE